MFPINNGDVEYLGQIRGVGNAIYRVVGQGMKDRQNRTTATIGIIELFIAVSSQSSLSPGCIDATPPTPTARQNTKAVRQNTQIVNECTLRSCQIYEIESRPG
jgi:hypothetical protein